MMPRDRIMNLLPGLAFIVVLLLLLEYVTQAGYVRRTFLPPPSEVWWTLWAMLKGGEMLAPLGSTLTLFAVGFVLSTLLGIVLGLLMGTSQFCLDLLEPLVEGIRPIPKAALIPALMLFLGLGVEMKIVSIVLASFFPVLINTIQGVRGVDPVLTSTGRTFGYGRTAIILKIILPAAIPYIIAGVRVALALALLTTILAEMLAGTGGLGSLILDHQRSFRVRQMYAWLVVLALLGLALNLLMSGAERKFVPWLEKYRTT
jgi:ABC-type nitrate/sulfonate/bicarbonate transport system permease component